MQFLTKLNPKTVNLTPIGGNSELSPADIAACCAGANEAGLNLLIMQVCGQGEYKAIYESFLPAVLRLALRLKWSQKAAGLARLDKFVRIMLCETISDRKCPSCRGTKFSLIDPSKACRTCRGTGVYVLPDSVKAELMNISKQSYSKTWVKREREVKDLFEWSIHDAKRSIYSKLHEQID